MPTIAEVLKRSSTRLASVTDTPRLDAEILLSHAMDVPRARLLASLQDEAASGDFDALLERRLNAEPIAYILGEWEFYGLTLEIEAPVLVPRPETEHLVSTVLDEVGDGKARVLEIGTGSGCVSIAIAVHAQNCEITATDVSLNYLELARKNAETHGTEKRITFRYGDLFEGVGNEDRPFDVICANPPYVADDEWEGLSPVIRLHEDPVALLGGADGLDIVHRLVAEARDFLVPGGLLALEIGSRHFPAVRKQLSEHGYEDMRPVQDLAGFDRIICARLPK